MKTSLFVMREQSLRSQLVCLFGGFDRVKASKVLVFSVVLYLSHVLLFAWLVRNTTNTELVVCLYAFVFTVLFYRNISQVLNFVVQFVPVDVVDCLLRKNPKFEQPDKPMHGVFSPIKLHVPITLRCCTSSDRANLSSWLAFFSQQQPALFVIFKKLNDAVLDMFGVVHKGNYR